MAIFNLSATAYQAAIKATVKICKRYDINQAKLANYSHLSFFPI